MQAEQERTLTPFLSSIKPNEAYLGLILQDQVSGDLPGNGGRGFLELAQGVFPAASYETAEEIPNWLVCSQGVY